MPRSRASSHAHNAPRPTPKMKIRSPRSHPSIRNEYASAMAARASSIAASRHRNAAVRTPRDSTACARRSGTTCVVRRRRRAGGTGPRRCWHRTARDVHVCGRSTSRCSSGRPPRPDVGDGVSQVLTAVGSQRPEPPTVTQDDLEAPQRTVGRELAATRDQITETIGAVKSVIGNGRTIARHARARTGPSAPPTPPRG